MIYFKDSTNVVYAYPKSDLAQVERLNEVEKQLENISVAYSDSEKLLQHTLFLLNDTKNQLDIASDNEEPEEITRQLINDVEVKTSEYEKALFDFNQLSDKQEKIQIEHDSFLPVFYEIRENMSVMKKMTPKEVDAHLNPPISKEQLVAEAEQEKQSLILQASDVIAPLQDAVDLDIATEEENAQLMAWKKYRVLLNRVDTSLAADIEWPQKPS